MTVADRNDEKRLIRAAASGDEQALRSLYDTHCHRAYALALRLTRSEADAEEAVQDAFLRAFRALGGFRAEARFSTWFFRIVVNRCHDLLARRQKQRQRETDLDEQLLPSRDHGQDPLAAPRLQAALEQLPVGYREVLLLHDMLGLDHREIARTLGIRRGTSKSQLHKARARMREIMSQ